MIENTEIFISILVAAYNVEKYLDRCVKSLMNQTLKDIEIIIVDDGSTDDTGSLCDNYANIDSRIKVIHQSNLGLPLARKIGLDAAKGKSVRFIDSDDWCEPNMCEKLFERATESKADIVFCSAYRHRDDGVVKICNLPISTGEYTISENMIIIYCHYMEI